MKEKAMYPGSFDPFTKGHEDIVRRISNFFSEVIISVVDKPNKKILFSTKERVEMIESIFDDLPKIKVISYKGLTASFAKNNNISVMIRGIRSISDYEYEYDLAALNKQIAPNIETIFLSTSEKYKSISSSHVKELALLDGDVSKFLHPNVASKLVEKLGQINEN